MKKPLLLLCIIISINSLAQNLLWEKTFLNSSIYDSISANSIAVDAFGNIYTAGLCSSATMDFDPGPGVFNLGGSGHSETYISKLDASGNFVWARTMGGTGTDGNTYLILDNSNNIYIVDNGWYGTVGITISKLDASGNIIWSKLIANSPPSSAVYFGHKSKSIAIDLLGNLYITGCFTGTIDFNPGAAVNNITCGTSVVETFLLKLNNLGDFSWVKQYNTNQLDNPSTSVSIDSLGGIFLSGSFQGTTDFNPNAGIFNLTAIGAKDIFITKLNASGTLKWAKSMGGTNDDILYATAIDKSGNVYSTGYFSGIVDFNPGIAINNLSSMVGSSDIYISKLDSLGNYVWAKNFTGVYNDFSFSLALDKHKNIYTTGCYSGTVDFNPNAGVFNLSSLSTTPDIYISKIDSSGNFINALTFPGTASGKAFGITTDINDNIFLTGDLGGYAITGTTDFDPGVGVLNVTTNGYALFVMKMENSTTGISTINNNLNEINIYPNPANLFLTINTILNYNEIRIINSLGQLMLKQGNSNTVNTSSLEKGIYFIQLFNDKGKLLSTKKFVKE